MPEWILKDFNVKEMPGIEGTCYSMFILKSKPLGLIKIVLCKTEEERDELAYLFDTIQQAETV